MNNSFQPRFSYTADHQFTECFSFSLLFSDYGVQGRPGLPHDNVSLHQRSFRREREGGLPDGARTRWPGERNGK